MTKQKPRRFLPYLLLTGNIILGATSIGGGVVMLAGRNLLPLNLLKDSPFSSYLLPALALIFLVGGFSAAAVVLLLRRHPLGTLLSAVAGLSIVVFMVTEILMIGSPTGMAGPLQIFYIGLGLVLVLVSLTSNALEW
jgi:hypothetical protein